MSFKSLFTDDNPVRPTPADRSLEGWANIIMQPRAESPFVVQKLGHQSETGPAEQMEYYDRELFEGLFLRYGKAWVNAQMAQLVRKFPSYRQG